MERPLDDGGFSLTVATDDVSVVRYAVVEAAASASVDRAAVLDGAVANTIRTGAVRLDPNVRGRLGDARIKIAGLNPSTAYDVHVVASSPSTLAHTELKTLTVVTHAGYVDDEAIFGEMCGREDSDDVTRDLAWEYAAWKMSDAYLSTSAAERDEREAYHNRAYAWCLKRGRTNREAVELGRDARGDPKDVFYTAGGSERIGRVEGNRNVLRRLGLDRHAMW